MKAKAIVALLAIASISISAFSVATDRKAAREEGLPVDYVLHEWGTFTSVAGSDGQRLPGLQREEETLPWFVHAHEGMRNRGPQQLLTKGWLRPLRNVTIKMETPVLYFYADEGFRARVDVGFAGGSISEWYPQRTSGETPPPRKKAGKSLVGGDIDFAQGYQGAIRWDVDVLPPSPENDSLVFRGHETLNWIHPRVTDSNVVRTDDGEHEKYLFYRGVGNFELPLGVSYTNNDTLTISNDGPHAVPALLLFDYGDDGKVRYRFFDELDASGRLDTEVSSLQPDPDWQRSVYRGLVELLAKTGLYRKEADAMVRTWWSSYFLHRGTRVFWIVPDAVTNTILPLKAEPKPKNTVRVLMGRSEVLAPAFEEKLLTAHKDKKLKGLMHDRYYDAYVARVNQLLSKENPEQEKRVANAATADSR